MSSDQKRCAGTKRGDGRGARPGFASADRVDRGLQITHCTGPSALPRQPQDHVAVALAGAAHSIAKREVVMSPISTLACRSITPLDQWQASCLYPPRSAPSPTTPIAIGTSAARPAGALGIGRGFAFGDSAGGGGADDSGGGFSGGFGGGGGGGGDVLSAFASVAAGAFAGDVNYSHSEGPGGAWVCGRSKSAGADAARDRCSFGLLVSPPPLASARAPDRTALLLAPRTLRAARSGRSRFLFDLPEQRFGPWKQLGAWDDC